MYLKEITNLTIHNYIDFINSEILELSHIKDIQANFQQFKKLSELEQVVVYKDDDRYIILFEEDEQLINEINQVSCMNYKYILTIK